MSISTSSSRSIHTSSEFAISCGTISVDIQKSLLLAIYWRKTGECFLPKGRKNIGEELHLTALRETFEETGFPVQPLPLPITTLATTPNQSTAHNSSSAAIPLVTEPIAVTQRVTDGILKISFWYAAKVDSTVQQEQGTQQEGEDFDTVWIPFSDMEKLTWSDDRQISGIVVSAVKIQGNEMSMPLPESSANTQFTEALIVGTDNGYVEADTNSLQNVAENTKTIERYYIG